MNDDQKRVQIILEAMHTPLVLDNQGWGEEVPDWIIPRVVSERLAMIDDGGWDTATDAEIAAHLMTASLAHPFNGDWTQIYEHEVSRLIPQLVDVMPSAGNPLTSDQERDLKELKYKIRNRQIKEWKIKSKEENMKRRLVMEEIESTGKVLVGVMKDNVDPITMSVEGTIETVVPHIPEFIIAAEEKWKTNPKFPAYKAPAAPPASKPAAKTEKPAAKAKTTEDLPLLAGKKPEAPKEDDLPLVPNAKTPATPEEKPSEVTAAMQAAAGGVETGERPAVRAADPVAIGEALKQEKADADVVKTGGVPASVQPEAKVEQPAPAKAPAPVESKPPVTVTPAAPASGEKQEFEYYLKDGRGPFTDVQAALDAMGIDKDKRPQHNRWDRLSTALKDAIPRRIKGSGAPAAATVTKPAEEETPLLAKS